MDLGWGQGIRHFPLIWRRNNCQKVKKIHGLDRMEVLVEENVSYYVEFEDLSKASVSGQFCHLWPLITKLTSKSTLFNSLEMSTKFFNRLLRNMDLQRKMG